MSDSKKFNVAVLGATGTVGEAMISILEERLFPVLKLYPLASHRSAGETVLFKKKSHLVEDVEQFDFSKVQIALFSAGAEVSAIYAPKAVEAGCIVIDNTSYFRQVEGIPLVIPEVNAEDIAEFRNRGIIANPNCSTLQMLVALKPLHDAVGITRVNVATYQSVSGSGKPGIEELATQVSDLLNGRPIESVVYPKQVAFNVLPQCDEFLDNGYTREEMKLFWETQKIFKDPNIQVNATAVRVPVFYGHSMAIHLETARKISAAEAKEILLEAPGVIVIDENQSGGYPTPIPEASGTDAVYVGRIREDISYPLGLNLWVVSDNIRKGAALNAVQIAEILVSDYL
ncbi:MAG TPA: aspartate-semialdehyde dehydrogenase [Gammaproteobacteria bacterium]|nr:aspartate-semialdehyde dehydrogenase [Gammaproteobacteria bacterium]